MSEVRVESHDFQPKWYLNGFPKSGLHAVSTAILPVAKPMVESGMWKSPWAGPFVNNSWTNDWIPIERLLYKISRLSDGKFLKGHCGYNDDVERFLWYSGIAHVFIYRDLRDVVVSQAYHVVSDDNTRFAHPDKELYRELGSHEEVMLAVINGLDKYPGLFERWGLYAPWLEVDWVHKVYFNDLIDNTHDTLRELLRYGLSRVAPIFDSELNVLGPSFDYIVLMMEETMSDRTDLSTTFRKGKTGAWKKEFTPRVAKAFTKADTENWLFKLGMEDNEQWQSLLETATIAAT